MEDAKHARAWRFALLALCGFEAVAFAVWLFVALTAGGYISGIALEPSGQPFVDRVVAAPAKTGLRAGDLVEFRTMSANERWRWYGLMRGGSITAGIVRDRRPMRIRLVAALDRLTRSVNAIAEHLGIGDSLTGQAQ